MFLPVNVEPVEPADDDAVGNLAGLDHSRHIRQWNESYGNVLGVVESQIGDLAATRSQFVMLLVVLDRGIRMDGGEMNDLAGFVARLFEQLAPRALLR